MLHAWKIAEVFYTISIMHGTMPVNASEEHVPKKYLLGFYTLLLALGVIIYLAWGLMYGSWNIVERTNLGIYAVTVMLVGFGAIGIMLYSIGEKKE